MTKVTSSSLVGSTSFFLVFAGKTKIINISSHPRQIPLVILALLDEAPNFKPMIGHLTVVRASYSVLPSH
jgi:hypothetical protein